ncbi:hephaestin-like protein [Amphiura filiformis]|uniref:hephaestin-like protein n=1 Tax=Amphiura filiformis TaxID=82378 RepID=UPI003B224564
MDENRSYYLNDNLLTYLNRTDGGGIPPLGFDSNRMNGINGYVYGNLPGVDMCQGDRVAWHLLGMGTQEDVHTAFWHGNTLLMDDHRIDSMGVMPASFKTAIMTADNPGIWLIASEVAEHRAAGAQGLYTVQSSCGDPAELELSGVEREFFIQAEEYVWNYAPLGRDNWNGQDLSTPGGEAFTYFETGRGDRIGGSYIKARYRLYTDDTFVHPIERAQEEEYLGILGPVIRAEVGDTLKITFRNNASRPYSMTPHGVWYDKSNEGRAYEDGDTDASDENVQPGDTVTYTWKVPEAVAPGDNDDQCITWTYFSSVDPERDIYSGLIGPLLVCRDGSLDENGKQKNVDHEYILLFVFLDENRSWYLQATVDASEYENIEITSNPHVPFYWSNQMSSINGYMFANIEGLTMCAGDTVSWHLFSVGYFFDSHPVYFRGNTFVVDGRRRDTIILFPGIAQTAIMKPDSIGTWSVECQMHGHFVAGMKGFYEVQDCGQFQEEALNGVERKYYIAAVEMEWDYAPEKSEDLLNPRSFGYRYTHQGDTTIGSKYKKALYREFTDETFTMEKVRSIEDMHLGALGPFIRAEVGDKITVVFKNMAASKTYSIHPHGVLYKKTSEGSLYNDGVNDTGIVEPGETYTYKWFAPMRSGPTETGANCVVYSYYSCVDCRVDPYTGLTGPLVICRPGTLGSDGRRDDADHEYVLQFYIYEEFRSHYYQENIDTYTLTPDKVDTRDPFHRETNRMHAINGYIYFNLKHLEMNLGQRTSWYVIGLGHEVDVHPVHFHGQVVTFYTDVEHRADVYDLLPGEFATLEMFNDDPGEWLLHCHSNFHKDAGMETTFKVFDNVAASENGDHECARECKWPPEPKTCHYVFTVEWLQSMSAACFDCPFNMTDCDRPGCIPIDGVQRPIVTVNRQIPGPPIQVCEEDEVEVKVWNRLGNSEGTSIHWHGIHQRGTPYMDGAAMITQCPISPQSSFTYKFKASPAGTHWWHSHSNLQRQDGAFGAFIVKHAPERDVNNGYYDYDLPEHVVFIQDWPHDPTISRATAFPPITSASDTLVINAKGVSRNFTDGNSTGITPREVFDVKPGARYRFRVIGNNICHLTVAVENHELTVIASDGVPIKPVVVDQIGLSSGERYDFVLTADKAVANYWFRLYTTDPFCSVKEEFAVLRYEGSSEEEPSKVSNDGEEKGHDVLLNPRSQLDTPGGISVVQLESQVSDDEKLLGEPDVRYYLAVGINAVADWSMYDPTDYPNPSLSVLKRYTSQLNYHSFHTPPSPLLTQVGDIPEEEFCDADETLATKDECIEQYCACTQIIKVDLGQVVELVLVGEDFSGADHPMSIHGYSFRVVAMGKLPRGTTVADFIRLDQHGNITRKLENAVLKDTVQVQGDGYTIIRFKADNPGWWLLHSNKIFDVSTSDGMAITIKVGESSDLPPVPENFPRCGSWSPSSDENEDEDEDEEESNEKQRKGGSRVVRPDRPRKSQ